MNVDVLLPLKINEVEARLTYQVPETLKKNVALGQLAQVPVKDKKYWGIIVEMGKEPTKKRSFALKEVLEIPESPALKPWQMEWAGWIAHYYRAPLFKVLSMMLPKAKKEKRKKEEIKTLGTIEKKGGLKALTPEQKEIVDEILKSSQKKFLIQGVTGSGKTEIYVHLAREMQQQGKQSLILVPEISLTPQLIRYFKEALQCPIAVLHSRRTLAERDREWWRIEREKTPVVIGSRSALFAPWNELGLIVIDEEHETSYKQDQTPRYHARETAFKLTELLGIKVVLGSATPSLESRYKSESGGIERFSLTTRVHAHQSLAEVQLVDLREELKKGNFSIFSEELYKKLEQTFTANHQAILFLNRRGNASSVLCRDCGQSSACKACETPLTHHKLKTGMERMVCHHCGRIDTVPEVCSKCHSHRIKFIGIGTQRVEEDLQKCFPTLRILRADKDSTQHKDSFEQLYQKLRNHEVDAVIGTQMIGKGWDIPNVTLVGVILADVGLHLPDFRASERNFQLLTQVAGRAGRGDHPGEVVIQTYNPENLSLKWAEKQDYESFYKEEITHRKALNYPPFSCMVKFTIKNKEQKICSAKALQLEKKIKEVGLKTEVACAPAMIAKKNHHYYWNVFLWTLDPQPILNKLEKEGLLKEWQVDVDPISTF
ncbi:MAG: hypothetical protein ACD_28C00189G0003 [uncultured bacterium]|nr:MAG: hypothetical protein ACD_28C00189G0003 [uncultured bacterium]KKT72592.1 MAG: Primosomal protein N' [Candidatus Peregrinibacteria bacterium GW2011_GWA2_44_7]